MPLDENILINLQVQQIHVKLSGNLSLSYDNTNKPRGWNRTCELLDYHYSSDQDKTNTWMGNSTRNMLQVKEPWDTHGASSYVGLKTEKNRFRKSKIKLKKKLPGTRIRGDTMGE